MRKIIPIIFTIITLSLFTKCSKQVSYVIISGQIKNYSDNSFKITGNNFSKELKVNSQGIFADTLYVNSNFYHLYADKIYIPIFLKQGEKINIQIDSNEKKIQAYFLGNNSLAHYNNYLQYKKQISNEFQVNFVEIFKKEVTDFEKAIYNLEENYSNLLQTQKLVEEYIIIEEKSNKYELALLKEIYPKTHKRLTKSAVQNSEKFVIELAAIDYDNAADFETFKSYRDLVTESFITKLNVNTEKKIEKGTKYINDLKSKNIQSHLSRLLVAYLSAKNKEYDNDLIVKTIQKFAEDQEIIRQAQIKYDNLYRIEVGKSAPNFNLENQKGDLISLESFNGKVVYIDIWATWCAPCINEIPAIKSLENKYHNKDIVFLSISIDKDKQKWKDFLRSNKMQGIQLYAGIENEFVQIYNIKTIPRFILIDKQGKIVDDNALKPSNTDIYSILNKYL
ncbi:TlpA family protein disulfide reductase [Capnocytophaga canimorsus]|uniref:TlpA family protein disulfide reductase n=1 Tax=Capnocytophaga canimorsus TaxID=28188 RepID=UPI0037D145E9